MPECRPLSRVPDSGALRTWKPASTTHTDALPVLLIFLPRGLVAAGDVQARSLCLELGSLSVLTKAKAFLEFSLKGLQHNPALPLLGWFVIDSPSAFSFNQNATLVGGRG